MSDITTTPPESGLFARISKSIQEVLSNPPTAQTAEPIPETVRSPDLQEIGDDTSGWEEGCRDTLNKSKKIRLTCGGAPDPERIERYCKAYFELHQKLPNAARLFMRTLETLIGQRDETNPFWNQLRESFCKQEEAPSSKAPEESGVPDTASEDEQEPQTLVSAGQSRPTKQEVKTHTVEEETPPTLPSPRTDSHLSIWAAFTNPAVFGVLKLARFFIPIPNKAIPLQIPNTARALEVYEQPLPTTAELESIAKEQGLAFQESPVFLKQFSADLFPLLAQNGLEIEEDGQVKRIYRNRQGTHVLPVQADQNIKNHYFVFDPLIGRYEEVGESIAKELTITNQSSANPVSITPLFGGGVPTPVSGPIPAFVF